MLTPTGKPLVARWARKTSSSTLVLHIRMRRERPRSLECRLFLLEALICRLRSFTSQYIPIPSMELIAL